MSVSKMLVQKPKYYFETKYNYCDSIVFNVIKVTYAKQEE